MSYRLISKEELKDFQRHFEKANWVDGAPIEVCAAYSDVVSAINRFLKVAYGKKPCGLS